MALQYFDEDGWRDDSPSKVRQAFLRGDWRGSKGVITASALLSNNDLIGNGLIPDGTLSRAPRVRIHLARPDEKQARTVRAQRRAGCARNRSTSLRRSIAARATATVNGDIYEGFDDFSAETDVQRNGLRKLYPNLPWCQLADLLHTGRADPGNPVLNGPAGVNCTTGDYASYIPRNGGSHGVGFDPSTGAPPAGIGPGVVDGTPIGLLSKTTLDQLTDGAALQANWNLQKHRFMMGASADRSRSATSCASASDSSTPTIAYTKPRIRSILLPGGSGRHHRKPVRRHRTHQQRLLQRDLVAGQQPASDAGGSIQRHERQEQPAHSNGEGSARLDQIHSRNVVPFVYAICTTTDPASCSATPAPVPFDFNGNAVNQTRTQDNFDYESFNPQVGINWLPIPTLNLFGNVSRGARVPSVVELGCAFDSTPVPIFGGPADDPKQVGTRARSLAGPTCNLPTTLSGDPFLPQIRSTSGEVGRAAVR